MEQIELAERTAALAGRVDQGTVRIGVIASLSTGFLHDLLLRFSKRHAGVRLVVSDGSTHDNIELVQSRTIDMAFLIGEPAVAGCETLRLWSEDAYIAVSNMHELAQVDTVAWEDLSQEHFIVTRNGSGPVVHDFLIRKLSDFASRVEIEPMDVTRDIMLGLVGMGRGISLVGEAATGTHLPGLVFRPIAGAQDSIPYSAVWSKENDNYAFRRLLSFAKIMAGKERRAIAKLLKGAAD